MEGCKEIFNYFGGYSIIFGGFGGLQTGQTPEISEYHPKQSQRVFAFVMTAQTPPMASKMQRLRTNDLSLTAMTFEGFDGNATTLAVALAVNQTVQEPNSLRLHNQASWSPMFLGRPTRMQTTPSGHIPSRAGALGLGESRPKCK